MFAGEKVGDPMTVALDPVDAKNWFGAVPPDLSVIARSRAGNGGSGADYLYTYLRTYYRDDSTATGWNNLVFPNVAMPHVLWELQGQQRAVFAEEKDPHDADARRRTSSRASSRIAAGSMTPAQYDEAVADLVAFLQWMGEPDQRQTCAPGRLRAAVPGRVHGDCVAPECRVLERRQVAAASAWRLAARLSPARSWACRGPRA